MSSAWRVFSTGLIVHNSALSGKSPRSISEKQSVTILRSRDLGYSKNPRIRTPILAVQADLVLI